MSGYGLIMTKCEIKGCELVSKFHGFGHDYCWQHYSSFMLNPYRPVEVEAAEAHRLENPSLAINSSGHAGQMALKF